MSGSKFYYLRNAAALLELALLNWAYSRVASKGFTMLATPDLVRMDVLEKCGFQPRMENTQVGGHGRGQGAGAGLGCRVKGGDRSGSVIVVPFFWDYSSSQVLGAGPGSRRPFVSGAGMGQVQGFEGGGRLRRRLRMLLLSCAYLLHQPVL